MQFLSLAPFVPSGKNFEASKVLFQQLGFTVTWDAGDYVGLKKMKPILFCRNLMMKLLRRIS